MKRVFFVLLKILGAIFYLFVALVIGVGFLPIAGWLVALAGLAYIIIRHYKKKSKKTSEAILNNKVEKSTTGKNVEEKNSSGITKSVINEKGKDYNLIQPVVMKENNNVSSDTSNLTHVKVSLSDLFKAKKFKLELENLKQTQKALEKEKIQLKQDNSKLQKEADLKLSVKQMQPLELDKEITKKTKELDKLKAESTKELIDLRARKTKELNDILNTKQEDIEKLNADIDKKIQKVTEQNKQISNLDKKIKDLNSQLVNVSDEIMYEDYGLYKPRYDFANSSAYKGKLSEVRSNQKEMIKNGDAGTIFNPMTLDGSEAKGRSMQKKNIKQLVRSFNGECEAAINKVTKSNIEMIEKRITRSFEQLNKLNEPNGVRLTANYLDSKLDEAHIALEYALKKEQEK